MTREDAIDEIRGYIVNEVYNEKRHKAMQMAISALGQPEYRLDEWCTDCKEYDHEKHCCPRYNRVIRTALADAQTEIKNNRVNLCDSCRHTYPDCGQTEVLFGDGVGHDNICCCGKYEADRKKGKWVEEERFEGDTQPDIVCQFCGIRNDWYGANNFCPNCGADMRGEQNATNKP